MLYLDVLCKAKATGGGDTGMTLLEIKEAIKIIEAATGDPESAHVMEDDLYENVMRSIVKGTCKDPVKACKLALTTKNIDFARWYA